MTASALDITGDLDGFAILFRGRAIAVRPTWDEAVAVLRDVRRALAVIPFSLPTDSEVATRGLPELRSTDAGPYPRSPKPHSQDERKGAQ